LNKKYKIGDELELKIEKVVPRGLGLAFAEGLTVFVPLSATGDRIRAEIVEIKGRSAFCEIVSVVEPSADRIKPPCPYFGICGGCDFMHLSYAAQLSAKAAMIRDCIERIGKIDYRHEIAVIESPSEFGYRLRAQWHGDPRTGEIGYYQRNSRKLVDVKDCLVLVPELQAELDRCRENLSPELAAGMMQIDAAAGDNGDVSIYSADLLEPTKEIGFTAAGERLAFSARSFFQGNRFLVDKLVEVAIGDASGGTALDLYCGVGLFTLPLARRFGKVVGVEDNEQAVELADANAERAGLKNIDLYAVSVREYLASGEAPKPDFVLLDPPRAGTEKETVMNLIALEPQRVSYVACEPSILARDLRRFVDNGYAIKSITALDLFPQTHHVETVAQLIRTEPGAVS
jgi:tRNA/tmRNA/rRNA uracil-C5-methylase (TrmA/RlmC/RlmD family)